MDWVKGITQASFAHEWKAVNTLICEEPAERVPWKLCKAVLGVVG